MKNTIKTLIFGCLASMSVSCEGFLSTSPKGQLSPETYYDNAKNIEAALTGVYSILGNSALYGLTYSCSLNNDADESFYNRSTYTYGPAIYNYTSSDASVSGLWSVLYQGIGRANMLLYHLPGADMDDNARARVKGETLFLRAYFYFLLVQNFGRVPLELEPDFTPDNLNTPQSDIDVIYRQIVEDMEEAEGLVLPINEIGHGGRISKSAVRGILARVYLTMAGYPLRDTEKYVKAQDCLTAIINDDEYQHSLLSDYNQVFINYAADLYDIRESIWEVEFWGNLTDAYSETGRIGDMNGITNNLDEEIGQARGMLGATGTLYNRYEEGDKRRDRSIATYVYKSEADPNDATKYVTSKSAVTSIWGRCPGKYRREEETLMPKTAYNTPINYPLLRYSDVLLMYAEVENEINQGPTQGAYDAINQVRRRGFGKMLSGATNVEEHDLSGLGYEEFKAELQDERSRELCFESLRRFDLIRWGIFIDKMEEVEDLISAGGAPGHAKRAFENIREKHLLHPIPAKEILLNKSLKQNTNW